MGETSHSGSEAPIVALPETRQLDVLAQLLDRRSVEVIRCPMVAIKDTADTESVNDWITRFIESPMDLLIVYTGEGIQRLVKFSERAGSEPAFVAALARTPLLTRGPKPVRALRKLDIRPAFEAVRPTTDGVIATLADMDLQGKRLGVQLYGSDPNTQLMSYLDSRDVVPDCVAPYEYAAESDDAAVDALIEEMVAGRIDAIAFTSKAQVQRLEQVAVRAGKESVLHRALGSMVVAAVGPVVAGELTGRGIRVDVQPARNYFMKPLVAGLMERIRPET